MIHLRFGAPGEHLLVLRRRRLIVVANEIGRRDVPPGGVGDLGFLHFIRLYDQPRSPELGFRGRKIVVEGLLSISDAEAAIRLRKR